MVLIPVPPFYFGPSATYGAGIGYVSHLLDAADERVGVIVQPPKTGNIVGVRFRTVTVTTGQPLRLGIYTVDESGHPTTASYGGMAAGTASIADTDDNAIKEVTLATSCSVVSGDTPMAVTIEFDSTIGNLNIAAASLFGKDFPYTAHYTTSWTKLNTPLAIALLYDDGSEAYPIGILPPVPTATSNNINIDSTTQDEVGNVFTAPARLRVAGVMAPFDANIGSDYELVAYNGTTELTAQTKQYDGDHCQNTAGQALYQLMFASPLVVEAGDEVRFSLKPTTTSSIAPTYILFQSQSQREYFAPYVYRCRRIDEGAWTDEPEGVGQLWPLVDMIDDGTGPDISGPHIVSGSVALNSDGSNPVSGAMVRIIRQSDNGVLQTTSGISGSYSFSVASGSAYHVVAEYITGSQRHNWRSLFDITASAP